MTDGTKTEALSEAGRIASFIGLRNPSKVDDLELVNRVNKGFPAATVTTIVKKIDPGGQFLKTTDIVPRSTLHRRGKSQNLKKEESERVLVFSKVFTQAVRIYGGDTARAVHFFTLGHPLLGGRSPLSLVKESTAGADLVLKLLAKAEAGVAA